MTMSAITVTPSCRDDVAIMWFHSTKFDGSLHYRHRVTPVRQDDGFPAAYLRSGERLESYRGVRVYPHHLLGL